MAVTAPDETEHEPEGGDIGAKTPLQAYDGLQHFHAFLCDFQGIGSNQERNAPGKQGEFPTGG